MRTIQQSFLAVLLFAITPGCGDDDGGGGGGTTVDMDAVPGQIAATFCDQLRACGSDLFVELFLGGAECVPELTRQLEDQSA